MSLVERIKKKGLFLDGPMGSMLISAGLEGGKTAEGWVLERPEEILKVHEAYAAAGAELLTTATFGANSVKLDKAGLGERISEINQTAVKLARQAAGDRCLVAGNIGPTGELLRPAGMLTEEDATKSFTEQARLQAEAGVDLFLLQTFYDVKELLAAVKGVQAVSDLPILATMTFQDKKSGFFTIMGNKVAESMQALVEAGCTGVGANCSIGSDSMVRLAAVVREAVSSPVIAQPNAGAPQMQNGVVVYNEDAETFADNLARIRELGVEVLGGCCGSTPDYIQAMVQKIG